jgi:hypothetical protein
MDLQDLVTIPPNELQKGGFGFELVKRFEILLSLVYWSCRNEILDRLGMKSPNTKKTGTTIVGLIFKVHCKANWNLKAEGWCCFGC